MGTKNEAGATTSGLSKDEVTAVQQAASEGRRTKAGKNTEQDVLDAIEAMDPSDRAIAEGLHALVKRVAPHLVPRTWYGFPAYTKDGKVVFFWQYAGKFKTRFGHIGFQDTARLDEGTMWPTAFAVTAWDAANEKRVEELILRAIAD